MGVEISIWRWRVGCFVQRPGSKKTARCVRLSNSAYRRLLMVLLLSCTAVGAVSEPSDTTDIRLTAYTAGLQPWPPVGNYTCMLPCVPVNSMMSRGTGADASTWQSARHSRLIIDSLLVQGGIEQNPGPGPETRGQAKLDKMWPTASNSQGAAAAAAPKLNQSQAGDPSLRDIMTELRSMRAELHNDIKEVQTEVATHTAHLEEVDSRQSRLEEENQGLKQKINQLEDHNRRHNLIMSGIPESAAPEYGDATEAKVRESLVSGLNMDQDTVDRLSIDRAQRLGRKGAKPRPIKVTFIMSKDKSSVLKKAREVKPETPYVREDFSPAVLEARANLKPGLLAARDAHMQAHLVYDKLIVQKDGKRNVYIYDCKQKTIRALSHTFEDNLRPNHTDNAR